MRAAAYFFLDIRFLCWVRIQNKKRHVWLNNFENNQIPKQTRLRLRKKWVAKILREDFLSLFNKSFVILKLYPLYLKSGVNVVQLSDRTRLLSLTYSILEVLMSDQFEVLFYGFGGQSVLSEDKVFSVDESVHLTHRHVWKEILRRRRGNCDFKAALLEIISAPTSERRRSQCSPVPSPSLCSAGCARGRRPLPLCSWRSARAPARHTVCGSYWWRTRRTPCTAPWAGCSWSGSGIWGVGMHWWSSLPPPRLPWWGRWAGWPGTTAPQTDGPVMLEMGMLTRPKYVLFSFSDKNTDSSWDKCIFPKSISNLCADFRKKNTGSPEWGCSKLEMYKIENKNDPIRSFWWKKNVLLFKTDKDKVTKNKIFHCQITQKLQNAYYQQGVYWVVDLLHDSVIASSIITINSGFSFTSFWSRHVWSIHSLHALLWVSTNSWGKHLALKLLSASPARHQFVTSSSPANQIVLRMVFTALSLKPAAWHRGWTDKQWIQTLMLR